MVKVKEKNLMIIIKIKINIKTKNHQIKDQVEVTNKDLAMILQVIKKSRKVNHQD